MPTVLNSLSRGCGGRVSIAILIDQDFLSIATPLGALQLGAQGSLRTPELPIAEPHLQNDTFRLVPLVVLN